MAPTRTKNSLQKTKAQRRATKTNQEQAKSLLFRLLNRLQMGKQYLIPRDDEEALEVDSIAKYFNIVFDDIVGLLYFSGVLYLYKDDEFRVSADGINGVNMQYPTLKLTWIHGSRRQIGNRVRRCWYIQRGIKTEEETDDEAEDLLRTPSRQPIRSLGVRTWDQLTSLGRRGRELIGSLTKKQRVMSSTTREVTPSPAELIVSAYDIATTEMAKAEALDMQSTTEDGRRLPRMLGESIDLTNKKTFTQTMRLLAIYTAFKWGYNHELDTKKKSNIANLACKLVAYDNGYRTYPKDRRTFRDWVNEVVILDNEWS